jgi:hypothetical protein
METLTATAIESENWRATVKAWGTVESDVLPEETSNGQPDEPQEAAPVRFVTIEVPVIETLPVGGYFSADKFPRSLGSGDPIAISVNQGRAYASVFRGLEALANAGKPLQVGTARSAKRGVTRDAKNPYDVVRYVLEQIAEATA